MARPILIDTDTGVDDALALIYALRCTDANVVAITTVAGNVEVEKCTHNVLTILDLLDINPRPPVAQGAAKPLVETLLTAPEVHGDDGLGNTQQGRPILRATDHDAVQLITKMCRDYGSELTIITLGPMTNLARVWQQSPQVLASVERIVAMGGAFWVPGNTGPVAEFNFYVDPQAAHLIFNAGLAVTVVPLDLTEQLVLYRSDMVERAAQRPGPVTDFVMGVTANYMRYHVQGVGFLGGYLHDPTAVAIAIEPGLAETQRVHVDVEAKGEFTRGMTVADFRRTPGRQEAAVDVVMEIERERFLARFDELMWG